MKKRSIMQNLANHIAASIGKRNGFVLLVYEHDNEGGGRLHYTSNSNRDDVVTMLREFIEKTESSYMTHEFKAKGSE